MVQGETPVILGAVRTPIGRYLGALAPVTAPQLGALVIREAVRRAGIDAGAIDEVIMGQVLQGGVGQAPARQAAIHAGLPSGIPAVTVNKVCGSGLKAVMLAAQAIKAGDAQCVVAGGMESMSNAPHYLFGMRRGVRIGNSTLVDGMIHDGLWDSFRGVHMGSFADETARRSGISRAEQDQFALESHKKAVAALDACRFKAETIPVEVPAKEGSTSVGKDEAPRRDTSLAALAALKPAFDPGGTVTAGNAPAVNDAASALVVASLAFARAHGLAPLARIRGYAGGGGDPQDVFYAPIGAVRNLLAKDGTKIGDYDLIEANEAFAVQMLVDGRALGWDCARAPDRRVGCPRAHHAALRDAGPEEVHRPRDTVSGRRERCGFERGGNVTASAGVAVSVPARRAVAAALGVALVAAAAQIAVPLPGTPVPVTLQPLAVLLVGGLLGPTLGAASMILYLALGAAGLPVFTPYGLPGIARLLGPTGGYLLAYPVAAFAVGKLAGDGRRYGRLAGAVLSGLVLIHLGGLAQLIIITGSAQSAVRLGTAPFVLSDLGKVAVAVLVLRHTLGPARARL
jgi:acetyl-CoA C-acetyltransferase